VGLIFTFASDILVCLWRVVGALLFWLRLVMAWWLCAGWEGFAGVLPLSACCGGRAGGGCGLRGPG